MKKAWAGFLLSFVAVASIAWCPLLLADTSFDEIYPSNKPARPASPFAECQKALIESPRSQAEKILSGLNLDTKRRLLELLSKDSEVSNAQTRQSAGASLR